MCRVLKASRSNYYHFAKASESKRTKENKEYLKMIREIFTENNGNYGSPRIHEELLNRGNKIGVNRVARIMKKEQVKSVVKRRFKKPQTTDSKHNFPIATNVLNQDFSEKKPGEIFVSDITYIKLGKIWVYLCVIMDLGSRKVVGWSLSETMKTELVTNAFQRANKMSKFKKDSIFHSDRGVQYASYEFREILEKSNMIQSMSRKGNCYDNACMESFFNTLKRELINKNSYLSIEELKNDLFEYIEVYYNNQRIHSSLEYITPREYELNYFKKK